MPPAVGRLVTARDVTQRFEIHVQAQAWGVAEVQIAVLDPHGIAADGDPQIPFRPRGLQYKEVRRHARDL